MLVALAIAGALLLGGCAQIAEKAVEQATGVQVSEDGDTVSVKGKDGETATFGKLPDQLKSFAVPQGFTFVTGLVLTQEGKTIANANWKGQAQFDSVVDFYRKDLPGKGWKEGMSIGDKESMVMLFTKGEEALQITFANHDGKGEIELNVSTWKDPTLVSDLAQVTPLAAAAGKGASQPTATAESTAEQSPTPEATPTAEPEVTPTPAAAATADPAALPAEIKAIPLPDGFAPLEGEMVRLSEGGEFQMAAARFVGKAELKAVGEFYQKSLPNKGWQEEQVMNAGDALLATYSHPEEGLELVLAVEKGESGTVLAMELVKQ